MKKLIKSSKHTVKFANAGKRSKIARFLNDYRIAAQVYIDYLWSNKIVWKDLKGNIKTLDIAHEHFDIPQFISTVNIPITTNLSARALRCCSNQACGMIGAAIKKHSKRLYKLEQLKSEGLNTEHLQRKIDETVLVKPTAVNIKAELNSICCDYQKTENNFNAFLQLKCLGSAYGKIRIPIKNHRHSNRLASSGRRLNSYLISERSIDIRYEMPKIEKKSEGLVVGVDQGINTVITFSNNQTTPVQDRHGHSLNSIMRKLARKKKGSAAFKKAQDHRANFINWSINQLNLSNIQQVNLEEIINIGYKQPRSRFLSHFTNTLIRDKLIDLCQTTGVSVVLQSSTYRSQRCSICGMVRKANRKGKDYNCRGCGASLDSDLNAAKNHEIDLPDVPYALRSLKLNIKGFYWKPEGFFGLNGAELTVPLSNKKRLK